MPLHRLRAFSSRSSLWPSLLQNLNALGHERGLFKGQANLIFNFRKDLQVFRVYNRALL